VKSHKDRWELRSIAAEKEANEISGNVDTDDDDGNNNNNNNNNDDDDDDGGGGNDNHGKPWVSGIFIHPVKSLQPVSLSETKFDKHGLVSDRRLMIVRPNPTTTPGEATHRFLTQRQSPSLATIEASKPVEVQVQVQANNTSEDESKNMMMTAKTLIKLSSSLLPATITENSNSDNKNNNNDNDNDNNVVYINIHPSHLKTLPIRYRAGLWGDVVEVIDVGDEAAAFVARIAGKDDARFEDARVVAIARRSARDVSESYCPDAARVGWLCSLPQGGLTDGFPILVATQASLDELNKRLAKKDTKQLPMNRFRPNIVINNTSKPFDEDNWKAIQFGKGPNSVILHIAKGCPRCKQSCTDQSTGERGEEPLDTLSEFRALGTTSDADVYFAQNAVLNGDVSSYNGVIKVGDPVTILTWGDPVWDKETVQAE